MTPPAMFAPMYSSFSAPSQQVAPVPSVAQRSQPICNVQQQPTCGPSPFRYVHSPYSFTGYEAHRDLQATASAPVQHQTHQHHQQYQARCFPMDVACPPFPTQLINLNCSTTCSTITSTTPPRAVDPSHHTQNQPQVRQHELFLGDDDVSSEETDESEPLSDSTVVCDHYAHWKRLRSKRGNACFVCRLCSAKWKMPTIQAVNFRAIVLTIPHIPRSNSGLAAHTDYHTLPVAEAESISSSTLEAESETEESCGPNCQHVSQWKRLRTKRGAAFFVCFECGCKWRTPAPPTQADRRNGWYYHAFPALLFGFY